MANIKRVAVLGGGSFGTVLANIAASNGYEVSLWVRDAEQAFRINSEGANSTYHPELKLSENISVGTLIYETKNKNEYLDSNYVKVIVDKQLRAITFTRKPITSIGSKYLIHLGVYGFKFKSLEIYSMLKECHYEKEESLEQLRMIWNNIPIHCVQIKDNKSIGINSARDLKKARDIYEY